MTLLLDGRIHSEIGVPPYWGTVHHGYLAVGRRILQEKRLWGLAHDDLSPEVQWDYVVLLQPRLFPVLN